MEGDIVSIETGTPIVKEGPGYIEYEPQDVSVQGANHSVPLSADAVAFDSVVIVPALGPGDYLVIDALVINVLAVDAGGNLTVLDIDATVQCTLPGGGNWRLEWRKPSVQNNLPKIAGGGLVYLFALGGLRGSLLVPGGAAAPIQITSGVLVRNADVAAHSWNQFVQARYRWVRGVR